MRFVKALLLMIVGAVCALLALFYLTGDLIEREALAGGPDCTIPAQAADEAEYALRQKLGRPQDFERQHVIFSEDARGMGVGLVYRVGDEGGQAAGFVIGPDCAIVEVR